MNFNNFEAKGTNCNLHLKEIYIVRVMSMDRAICDSGERAWKPIGDRLQRPHYLSRVDHERKISSRRQRTDIGKYLLHLLIYSMVQSPS